jgi:nucleoside-diphosphate-sugar epimerase
MTAVAVVGANGFIGSRLVEQWHLGGELDVVPIVRRPSAAASAARFGLDCRVADALDEDGLSRALAGADAVVHAAAGGRQLVTRSAATLARAAARAGVAHVVYLSSMAVHGWHPPPGTDEASPLPARLPVPYGRWKADAERVLAEGCRALGLRLVVLRPGIVYGPRSAWIDRFARAVLDDEATVVEGGRGVCNAVYVDNLAFAIRQALVRTDVWDEAFLISDAAPVSWRELYEPICLALGRTWQSVRSLPARPPTRTRRERYVELRDSRWSQAALGPVPVRLRYALSQAVDGWLDGPAGAPADDAEAERPPIADLELSDLQTATYRFPVDKAHRVLGYRPAVPFEEAGRRTIAWLRFAGFPVRDDRERGT